MAGRLVSLARRRLRAGTGGVTLVEVVLALSTLAVVALLAGAALRVGLRAWEAGRRQADAQQETRALVELITEALEGAFPYRGRLGPAPERVVLFEGEGEEVRFVSTAPPLALEATAPFHAVVLGLAASPERLRLLERLVPAEAPFVDGAETVLSRGVSRLRLAYRDEHGVWQDRWDGRAAGGLPSAVRVELTLGSGGRARTLMPVVIPIPLGKRAS